MSMIKYRVHEVAKDFKINGKAVGSKKVMEILTKYGETPSSHMAVLSDKELSIIFDYLTQKNQIEDLEEVFKETYQEPKGGKGESKKPAPKGENKKQPAGERKPQGDRRNAPKQGDQRTGEKRPQNNNDRRSAPAQKGADKAAAPRTLEQKASPAAQNGSRVPQKKVVNTRSSVDVNLDRYDAHLDELTPDSVEKMQHGKQKINSKRSQQQRSGKQSAKRRQEEQAQKMRRLQQEAARKAPIKVEIPDEITVGELASRMKKTGAVVVKNLMKMGVMASMSDVIDYDTAALVAMEIGAKVTKQVVVTIEDRLFEVEDKEEAQEPRPPIVVVMGHVDHGKTSILDAIRKTSVVSGEAGGITQHIGAYQVQVDGRPITFLDTPGHAAFTSMRARGAQVTDIAVLVVAADDGIMPQTVEAINHAKEAGVSIIVAINKMDKPEANPERIKQQLTEYELVPEEWGGDTICVPVSAKTGMGLDNLLEMILLVADTMELTANPNRMAKGTVIEAKLDTGRGPVATVLIQTGTLHSGEAIIAGTAVGRVRVMTNDKGQKVEEAGPSCPVEITGLAEVPAAGDIFNAVEDEKLARELVEKRRMEQKEEEFKRYQKVTLDNLFEHISEGEVLELPVIVKGDVQGSVEAVRQSLEKLSNNEVRVRVIHGAVGAVSESDVMLANASHAIIVGFNVRPDPTAKANAERDGVEIRLYRIIYDAIEEIEAAMKGMLKPKTEEVDLGRAEIRNVYKITGVGAVAGCYVLDGKMVRSANIRVVRDGIIIADDKMASLRRFKDDVKEVAQGYECGITLEKFSDLKNGDIFEAYEIREIKQ